MMNDEELNSSEVEASDNRNDTGEKDDVVYMRSSDGNFSCDQCDFKSTAKYNVKRHVANKHRKIRFPCDKCDKAYTDKGGLRKHVANTHDKESLPKEGLIHHCVQCDYTSSNKGNLKRHQESVHDLSLIHI